MTTLTFDQYDLDPSTVKTVSFALPLTLAFLLMALVAGAWFTAPDLSVWAFASLPSVVLIGIAAGMWRRFPLSRLACTACFLPAALLVALAGGQALLAELPAPAGLAVELLPSLGLGFAAVIVAREVLLRCSPLLPGRWLAFLSLCVAFLARAVTVVLAEAAGLASESLAVFTPGTAAVWSLLAVGAGGLFALFFEDTHDQQLTGIWADTTALVGWQYRS